MVEQDSAIMRLAYLIAFTGIIFSAQAHPISQAERTKLYNYHTQCLTKSGVDEKVVHDSHRGEYSEEQKFKDYVYCMSKQFGFQNDDGKLQKEIITEKLKKKYHDSGEVEKIVEKCVTENDSPLETAYQTFKCYHDNFPKGKDIFLYIIPVTEEKAQKIKKYSRECVNETGIDEKLIENARNGEYSDSSIFKQYLFCFSKKLSYQNEEGKLQKELIKEKLTDAIKDANKAQALTDLCVSEKETSEDTAFHVMKCFYENAYINYLHGVSLSYEKVERLLKYHRECQSETNVDKKLIHASCKGEFSDDPNLKEYYFCLNKKAGFLDEDGEFQREVLRKKLGDVLKDPVVAQELIEKCTVKKDTPQNTAYNTVKCYYENSPSHMNFLQVLLKQIRKQVIKIYHKECVTESGIEAEVIEKAKRGEFSENEKFKNHLFCLYKKLDLQDEKGGIKKTLLADKLGYVLKDTSLAQNLVEKCVVEKDSPQNTIYSTFICIYENSPSHLNIFTKV